MDSKSNPPEIHPRASFDNIESSDYASEAAERIDEFVEAKMDGASKEEVEEAKGKVAAALSMLK